MDQVLGQPVAIDVLQRQLASGRTHHAYIFHGPTGVGKFTAARRFARILLCHQPMTDLTGRVGACGSCESCQHMDRPADEETAGDDAALSTAHPDLHVITKELAKYSDDKLVRDRKLRSIPVGVIRDALIEPAHRSAQLASGKFGKVFIVDEAELLNPAGQNALLKTLEEPPTGTTIILITSNEDRLLPTIRSRCQRVGFVPLPEDVVRRWIEQRDDAPSDARQLDWLVRFAGGSLGRAGLALDYGLIDWARTILGAMRKMASGRAVGDLGGQLAAMIGGFADDWVKRHANASKDAANQLAAALCFGIIATEARRGLTDAAAKCDPADPVAGDALTGPWLAVIDALDEAERYLGSNVNLSLTCDHLALTINAALTGGAPVGAG